MLNTGKLLRQNLFCKAALVAALAPWPVLAAPLPDAAKIDFEFELPKIDTSMYARPYVAVWVEDEQRQSVKTIQLWVGKDEWLKDMRSWWRKVGRYDRDLIDAVRLRLALLGSIDLFGMVLTTQANALSKVIIPYMLRSFVNTVVATTCAKK